GFFGAAGLATRFAVPPDRAPFFFGGVAGASVRSVDVVLVDVVSVDVVSVIVAVSSRTYLSCSEDLLAPNPGADDAAQERATEFAHLTGRLDVGPVHELRHHRRGRQDEPGVFRVLPPEHRDRKGD